jgi:hypothetical protein
VRTEALLAGAALIVASSPVRAFVCSRAVDTDGNDTGPSLTWATRDLSFALHENGTEDVAALDELEVLRNSFQVWENVQECAAPGRTSDITFHERELTNLDLIGFDFLHPERNANVLIFRDDAWPHAGQGSLIIALTTTTYSAQTGEILDADIEFNSAGFEFTIGDTGVVTDLMNTAVHEIGHILGLGHSPVSDSPCPPRRVTATSTNGPSTATTGTGSSSSTRPAKRTAPARSRPARSASRNVVDARPPRASRGRAAASAARRAILQATRR